MLAGSMPNFATSVAFVETATKWRATAASVPRARTHQARAARAFVSVSSGGNVFDETMKSVSAGGRARTGPAQTGAAPLDPERGGTAPALWGPGAPRPPAP